MVSVAEINDPAHLSLFSQAWQTLWEQTPHRTLFHTRQWLECYCRHYGGRRTLRTLVVFRDSRPIGIVPLVVKRTPTWLGAMRWLTYPLDGWGPCFGPVRTDGPATMNAVLDHLAQTDRDWDVLDLRGIDGKQLDRRHAVNAFRHAALPVSQRLWETNYEIPVGQWSNGDWFFIQRRMADAEKSLNCQRRWEFVRARSSQASFGKRSVVETLWSECEPLFQQSRSSSDWWPAVFAATLDTQTADLCVLRIDGAVVAALLNTVVDGRVTSLALAVAPGWGPGVETLGFGQMLNDGLKRGDVTYLFGPKTRQSAERWPGTPRPSYRLTHFAPFVPRAQILRFNTWRNSWGSGRFATAPAT